MFIYIIRNNYVSQMVYPYIAKRIDDLGIKHSSLPDLSETGSPVIEWLKSTGKPKVMVHFDMDVINSADMLAGVVDCSEGGMKLISKTG